MGVLGLRSRGEGCRGWGGERGAWGLGGGRQEQYCCWSTPGARCQPEQKGRVSNGGGGWRGVGGGSVAGSLQPRSLSPLTPALPVGRGRGNQHLGLGLPQRMSVPRCPPVALQKELPKAPRILPCPVRSLRGGMLLGSGRSWHTRAAVAMPLGSRRQLQVGGGEGGYFKEGW